MRLRLWLCGLFFLSSSAWSQEPPTPLKTFIATYDARWLPVGLKGSATRTLRLENSGQAQLSFEGQAMGILIKENTQFHWQGCLPVPDHYSRQRTNFFQKNLLDEQTFDWKRSQVSTRHKDAIVQLFIDPPTYDPISIQLALACELKAGKKAFDYTVIYKQKPNKYSFKVNSTENLQTVLGTVFTIKVVRNNEHDDKQTTLWFAPEYDYALVKLEQKEADDNHYIITLRSLDIQ